MTQDTSQSMQLPSLPDEAFQLGEAHHLGTPIAAYRAHYSRSGAAFLFTQVLFLVFSLGVLVAALLIFFVYHTHNTLWLFYLIIALSSFNFIAIARRKNKDQPVVSPFERKVRIYVYKAGLIYIRNTRPIVIRWEQVRQVRYIRPKVQYGRTASVSVIYTDRGVTKRVGVGNILTNDELDALGTLFEQTYSERKAML